MICPRCEKEHGTMTIGELIRNARLRKGYELKVLAGLLNINESNLCRIETSHRKQMDLRVAARIANFLDLDLNDMAKAFDQPDHKEIRTCVPCQLRLLSDLYEENPNEREYSIPYNRRVRGDGAGIPDDRRKPRLHKEEKGSTWNKDG